MNNLNVEFMSSLVPDEDLNNGIVFAFIINGHSVCSGGKYMPYINRKATKNNITEW